MRCVCATHRAKYDRRYVRRVESGWPRWLAFLIAPPGSKDYDQARAFLTTYDKAWSEGRVGVGILGSVITDDREAAQRITASFGLRS